MPTAPHILIIRPSALGDVARTVPCLVSLRRAYPEAKIDWLIDRRYVDAIQHHPALDGVVRFDRHRLAAVGPMLRQLRRAKYDLVFDLQGLARSGVFAWATRAAVRVGYANAREWGWLGVNRRHRVDRTVHAMVRMLRLLEAHGVQTSSDLTLYLDAQAIEWRDRHWAELGVEPGRYACVAPTTKWPSKCWLMRRFAEVTQRLLKHKDIDHVFVIAAASDQTRIQGGFTGLTPEENRCCSTPQTDVGQMMALIQGARLLVGNDSAPLHLAVGLGTPTVSLFGPTDPAVVGPPPPEVAPPQGASHSIIQTPAASSKRSSYRRRRDDNQLIAKIEVDAVWKEIQRLLDETAG